MIRSAPNVPDAIDSAARLEYDRAWTEYMIKGRDPERMPSIVRDSWTRCRDVYRVDPGIKRSPLSLEDDQVATRRQRARSLQVGLPFLERLDGAMQDSRHVLGLLDQDGYVLMTLGDPAVLEELKEVNFQPGANWREDVTGTNGPGTALAEKRPVQIFASQHFVESLHRWVCTAAPIRDPITGKVIAIIDVTGYREAAQLHTLIAVHATASLIEQRILLELNREESLICEKYSQMLGGRPNDDWLAIDRNGRLLRSSSRALRTLRLPQSTRTLHEMPELSDLYLAPLIDEVRDQEIEIERDGRPLLVTIIPVSSDDRIVGGVALIRERGMPVSVPPPSLSLNGARERGTRLQSKPYYDFDDIIGDSDQLRQAIAMARLSAQNGLPVLIIGESGTGKEMFAQSLHSESPRASGPFVAVNCAAIPNELTDAEFFGYESGAFTGAKKGGNSGKFEQANGGTIFLDEVSELSPRAQASLLRTLQEMEVVRLGGGAPRPIDVRVIAATNKDLRAEIKIGRFRSDLFFRLNVMPIEIPPLRDRDADVELLARFFLDRAIPSGRAILTQECLAALRGYSWPGNVRELASITIRAAVLRHSDQIGIDLLPIEIRFAGRVSGSLRASIEGGGVCNRAPDDTLRMLERYSGNVARTARELGVSRMTLYRRMRKFAAPPTANHDKN